MANKGLKVVKEAIRVLGTIEKPKGSNKGPGFINEAQAAWNMGPGTSIGPQPWCGMAVSKWFRDGKVDSSNIPHPAVSVMCSKADSLGGLYPKSGEVIPPGSIIMKCGVHTEIVEQDTRDGYLDCIGGNVDDGVRRTRRKKSEWRICVPPAVRQEDVAPTKTIYWFEDLRKKPAYKGPWRVRANRERQIKKLAPEIQKRVRRIRIGKEGSKRAKYAFEIIPVGGAKTWEFGPWDSRDAREENLRAYEKANGYKVRRRARVVPA